MESTREGEIRVAEASVGVGQGSAASRVVCKLCIAKGEEASASRVGCLLCICKAAALGRIKAAGGDEEAIARRPLVVKPGGLSKLLSNGGVIVNEEKSMVATGRTVVTVRLPDAYAERLGMYPRVPLGPLPADYFDDEPPQHRETILACAVNDLSSIEREENVMAEVYKTGKATLMVEVPDGGY